ncbi:MAG: molybdenum ABC transporter ATP-binding protein [Pseudomonadota bacterium]|nr:molybdenum ABC transporter ATP-binding protein [Pseudomonadota bacterium]
MLEFSVSHEYEGMRIDVAFTAKSGSITSLYGRSGSGKTSIINMIAGLKKPDFGFIKVNGKILLDTDGGIDVKPEKRRLGYIFQDCRLFPHLNTRANLLYGLRENLSSGSQITFDTVVDILKIKSLLDRKPANLSGGEKQRVAIGRALLTQPRLLLMDEPLASVDAQLRGEILTFIEELRNKLGLTIIYVSHAIDEVIRLTDEMVIISNGIKKAEGDLEEIMSRLDLFPLTGRFDAGAVLSTKVISHDDNYGLTSLSFKGGTLSVTGTNLPTGASVRAHIRARDVSLMLERPKDTSILNIFEGKVIDIGKNGGAQIDIKIDIGSPLIARITRKSFEELGLTLDSKVYAMLKAVSIGRRSLGAKQ